MQNVKQIDVKKSEILLWKHRREFEIDDWLKEREDLNTEFFLDSLTHTEIYIFFDSVKKQAKFLQENFWGARDLPVQQAQRESAALELPVMR